MQNPYRIAATDDDGVRRRASRWDDRVLGVLMIGLGALRVVPAIVDAEPWGAEVTIAAVMMALGALLALVPSRG